MSEVVVVGSGAAGLNAALAAAQAGASVTILEGDAKVGGTTALSGGVAWLPANHLGVQDDSPDRARRYLEALDLGDVDADLTRTFTVDAPGVARWIEAATPLEWEIVHFPDYHAERDGAALDGRSLGPRLLDADPGVSSMVRDAFRPPLTRQELQEGPVDEAMVAFRTRSGTLAAGRALVGGLLSACLEAGVSVQTRTRAGGLLREPLTGRVIGVDAGGEPMRGSVILATGGFERDPSLSLAFLRGPVVAPVGAPTARGDGLRMAMGLGAMLGNMSEAWWCPAIHIPDEDEDGRPLYRLLQTERTLPGSIMVDSSGRRFVNEAQNYSDVGRVLFDFDPGSFSLPRLSSWLLFDARYRRRYGMRWYVPADQPDPDWIIRANSWPELAARIGAEAPVLEETVAKFNADAAAGHHPDFGRGTHEFDSHFGDPSAEHPTLAPLLAALFYAVEVLAGCVGTKGGPRTDDRGNVLLAESGERVGGLYAVGNVAANPFGWAYPGAGGTIGPALVFGRRAGEATVQG